MFKPNLIYKTFVLVMALVFSVITNGQVNGDYQTRASGNWNANTTWQVRSGGSWVNCNPGDYPGSSSGAGTVNILNNTIVTITANVPNSIGALSINGGTNDSYLQFNSGNSLTVSGQTYLNSDSNNDEKAIFVDAGIFSTGSFDANSSGNNNSDAYIRISTGSVIVNGNVTLNSTDRKTYILFTSDGILYIGGTMTGGTITSWSGGGPQDPTSGTVIYNYPGAQTVGTYTYYNLTLSGSGAKTMTGITIIGVLSMEGTATASGSSPTYNAASSLQYKGSTAQTTGIEFPSTFSGSGGVVIDNSNGLTLNSNRTIDILLSFINGIISTGTNTLSLASGANVTGAGASNYVFGNLQKGIAIATVTKTFEIGDMSTYTPVILDFIGTTNGTGAITAKTTTGDHPNINTSIISSIYSVNRYWTLTNSGVSGFTAYSSTFNFVAGDLDTGTDFNFFIVGNYNPTSWTYPTVGTKTATSTQATGMTAFGDFQIGRSLINSYRTIQTGDWNQTSTWETYVSGSWVAATASPTSADGILTITSSHVITNTSSITVDELTIENGATLILNTGIVISDGPGVDITINGTIDFGNGTNITGAGSFVLSDDADIIIRSIDGIASSGASGNVQTTTRTFNTGANYSYSGASAQITGDGLPSILNNLTINNSAGVTMTGSVTANGTVNLSDGAFIIGANTLTFQNSNTPILRTSGTITTESASDLSFGSPGNTGGNAFTIPAGTFTTPPAIKNLTVYRVNNLTLNDQMMSLSGIFLCNGPFDTNGNLILLSTATQTALIDGSGTGLVTGNVTMQRYLPSGFGYKYFSSPFQAATVNEFADDMSLGSFTFYEYDESRTSSGWVSYHTPTTNPLNPLQGYAINFGSSAAANTVDVTGAVNNGNLSVILYNNNNTYTQGFNLVGNPYPSPIDWEAAAGWTKTNLDDAIYYFKASATDQYGGTYSSYVSGVSSDGLATNVIPSMQGFFVHVTDGSYPVTGTFGMDNTVRITDLTHSFIKSSGKSPVPLLRLSANFSDDPASTDPLVVYFDEKGSSEFDIKIDALKLFNTDLKVPNIYAVTPSGRKLSIDALPPVTDDRFSVPLGLKLNRTGNIIIKIRDFDESLSGMRIYLSDILAGTEQDLLPGMEFSLNLGTGEYLNRFFLNFSNGTTYIEDNFPKSNLFKIYSYRGIIKAEINTLTSREGTIMVYNLTGQVLFIKKIYEPGYYEFSPGVNDGIYIVSFISGTNRTSKKIFIQN